MESKEVSVCESEDRGDDEGGRLYVTLMVSDTLQSYGRGEKSLFIMNR